jgi:alpha-galactosidase/6-phospho-beta-glucosidase family protein
MMLNTSIGGGPGTLEHVVVKVKNYDRIRAVHMALPDTHRIKERDRYDNALKELEEAIESYITAKVQKWTTNEKAFKPIVDRIKATILKELKIPRDTPDPDIDVNDPTLKKKK